MPMGTATRGCFPAVAANEMHVGDYIEARRLGTLVCVGMRHDCRCGAQGGHDVHVSAALSARVVCVRQRVACSVCVVCISACT